MANQTSAFGSKKDREGATRGLCGRELYQELIDEFEGFRALVVKFNISLLVAHSHRPNKNVDKYSPFHVSTSARGNSILFLVKYRWAQRFLAANRIVYHSKNWKLLVSPGKRTCIEKSVAYNLGCVK